MNTKKYVVKVNGSIVSPIVDSPSLAEGYIKQLNETQQAMAEVVTVDNTGKEFLFG